MAAPVLIVTGGPGAGKTTVARTLAERADRRAVHLDADRFFESIRSGWIPPWTPESHEQNRTVMNAVVAATAAYAAGGYLTILDGIVIPGWFFEPIRDDLRQRGCPVSYAVLRPSLDEAIRRSAERTVQPIRDPDVVRGLWGSFEALGELERHVIADEGQGAEAIASIVWDRFVAGDLVV